VCLVSRARILLATALGLCLALIALSTRELGAAPSLGYPPGALRTETWTNAVQLDHSSVQVVPSSSGTLVPYVPKGVTQRDGFERTWRIPAGNATGISAPALAALGVTGDVFNASHDMLVRFRATNGRTWGEIRDVGAQDSTAPTLVSVFCNQVDTPSAVVLTFSEGVYVPALTGISFTSTGGQSVNTYTANDPNAPTNLTLNLSGAMAGTETASVTITGANGVQDFVGNALGSTSGSVTFATRPKDLTNNTLDVMSLALSEVTVDGASPPNVLTAIDRSTLGYPVVSVSGHRPTWLASDADGTPSIKFVGTGGSEQYLTITSALPLNLPIDDTIDFDLFILAKVSSTAPAGNNDREAVWGLTNALSQLMGFVLLPNASYLSVGFGNPNITEGTHATQDALHLLEYYRHGAVWGVSVDGGTAVEAAVVGGVPPGSPTAMTLGVSMSDAATITYASNAWWKAIAAFNLYLSSGKRTAVHALIKGKFPACP
jgi:hypothetical protein